MSVVVNTNTSGGGGSVTSMTATALNALASAGGLTPNSWYVAAGSGVRYWAVDAYTLRVDAAWLDTPIGANSLGLTLWDCSTLTGYNLIGGSMTLVDSVDVSAILRKSTAKSIQFTVPAGTNVELELPVLAGAFKIPNKQISFVIEVIDGTPGAGAIITPYLNTGSYSHFYTGSFQLNNIGVQVVSPAEGTNIHEWAVGAGSPTFDTLTDGKLRVAAATTDLTVIVHAVIANSSTVPTVSIIHDDGDYTAFTKLMPLLNRYGFKAGFGIIADLITDTGSTYMYEKHLEQLYAEGHDLIPHGQYPLDTYGTVELALADIDANADWLLNRGYARGSGGYIYPGGVFMYSTADRTSILSYLSERGITDAWLASGQANSLVGGYGRLTRGRYAINAATNLTTLSNWLSVLHECGQEMTLMIHEIVDSGASGDQSNYGDIETLLADLRIRQDAGTLRVVTPSQQGALAAQARC